MAKIDYIICELGGSWYTESIDTPDDVGLENNDVLAEWAWEHHFKDDPNIIFVGVYWRDSFLELNPGISKSAAVEKVLEKNTSLS